MKSKNMKFIQFQLDILNELANENGIVRSPYFVEGYYMRSYYSHSFVIPSMILTGITMPEMTADRIKISTIKINCRDFYCYVPNYFYISSIVTSNFISWFLQMSISVS